MSNEGRCSGCMQSFMALRRTACTNGTLDGACGEGAHPAPERAARSEPSTLSVHSGSTLGSCKPGLGSSDAQRFAREDSS